jgi:hypothetical protein
MNRGGSHFPQILSVRSVAYPEIKMGFAAMPESSQAPDLVFVRGENHDRLPLRRKSAKAAGTDTMGMFELVTENKFSMIAIRRFLCVPSPVSALPHDPPDHHRSWEPQA